MQWAIDDKRINEWIASIGDCPICNKRLSMDKHCDGQKECVVVTVVVPKYLRGETGPDGQAYCWGLFDFTYIQVFCND